MCMQMYLGWSGGLALNSPTLAVDKWEDLIVIYHDLDFVRVPFEIV